MLKKKLDKILKEKLDKMSKEETIEILNKDKT